MGTAHNLHPPRVPLGATVLSHFQAQVDNGAAGQLVLYRFDFHNEQNSDHSRLNPYGLRRLRKMAALLSFSGLPLIVEETVETPQLNAARREQVIRALAEMSVAVDPQRVVLGDPPVHGLDGTEAPLIYENLLRQTVNGPSGVSASGAGGSGISGATSFGVEGTQ
ncbi:MAG: hypothetical protein J5I93_18240 [Pirellulaceae bacterium]|nr:hypothetical protein [Pirellulaceae bacterium]